METTDMANSYGHQLLVEQRVAELRHDAAMRTNRSKRPARKSARTLRRATGRVLVKVGERLAAPSGTAAAQ
jgi:hypothetical protein